MKLRKATLKDKEQIRQVALRSWLFAYKNIYKEKTIHKRVFDYYSDKAFKRDFNRIAKGKGEFIAACLPNKKIAGFVQAGFRHKRWEVLRIYIDPKFARKGLGTKLMNRIELFFRKKKAKSYVIYPHNENKIAIGFYNKYGFARKTLHDRGKNSPCFIKRLE
jgi:ribosomal protein S18 acetylase RimI-like enzyme